MELSGTISMKLDITRFVHETLGGKRKTFIFRIKVTKKTHAYCHAVFIKGCTCDSKQCCDSNVIAKGFLQLTNALSQ